MVSLPIFTPLDFLRITKDHKIEIVHLVPPMLNSLVNSPAVTSKELETVKVFVCAAAPVPPQSVMALKEKVPHPVVFQDGFGMTGILGAIMTPTAKEKIGSCGKLVSNAEVKIVNISTGATLPEGVKGVMDTGVVGVPDDRSGKLPNTYIVKKGDTSTEDIMKFMKE
ncbi:hypothetical protein SK128_024983 [Halocaridina rubra]|uniref:AMP-dependent synthetase/ligase domain-containing protein n=1 Tax=Halocaridina rubra TaxID=373956 RepID=A0AAN8XJX8_HALRR